MRGFGERLAKDGGAEAEKASKGWGKKIGVGLAAGAAAVGAGAALAVKALYSIGETFDEVSDTIRVGTGATGKDLDGLVESAKRVGTKVPAAFEDIGTVVADVNTRLGLTGPTLEKFSSQVLEATRIMGEEIDVRKMSSAFSAFQIKGEKTTDAMDHLYRVSQATGVGMNELAATVASNAPAVQALGFSFEETAALAGNLDKAGLNSSKMMAGMSRGLIEVAKSGEKPEKAFKRVTGEIQGYIKKGDKAKAIDLASKLFGTRNATQFIGALETGALAMDDLGKVTGMTEDTILGAGKETMDFAEQWQLFENNVLVKLEPIASKVFGLISDAMAWLVDNGIPAVEAFGKKFGPTFQAIWDKVKLVFDNVKTIISTAIQWVQDFWAEHGASILAEFKRIFDQVRTTVSSVFDSVKAIVKSVFGWLQTFWENWGGRITDFFKGMWERVKGVIDGALQIIRGIWETFAGLFTGDWERMWEGLKSVFEGAWKVVSNAIGNALDALGLVWEMAWSALVSVVGKIWDGIVGAVSGPINRVLQFIQENFIDKINGFFAFLHIPIFIEPIWRAQNVNKGGGGSRGKQAFSSGGYTGDWPVDAVAGVVHGREFVINANSTARIRRDRPGLLEALNGYRAGGYVSPALGRKIAASVPGYRSGGRVRDDLEIWDVQPVRRADPAPASAQPKQPAPKSMLDTVLDGLRGALAATIRSTIGGFTNLAASAVQPFGLFGQAAAGAVRSMGAGAADWAIRTLELEPTLYDQGGLLPPGLTLVSNQTGRPEVVLPPGGLGRGDEPLDLSARTVRELGRAVADHIQPPVTLDDLSRALVGRM